MSQLVQELKQRALQLRIDSVRATSAAGSGHPTSCMSAADIVATLFFSQMRYDVHNPHHPNNDRFILSKGHAVPVFYAALKQWGLISDEQLLTLRQFDSALEGHPTPRLVYNEAATGSLGQGLAVGVGMALYAQIHKLSYRTYVLLGDAEVAEGSVWEAMDVASRYKLANLVGIIDVNRLGQSGVAPHGHNVQRYVDKARAFGWHALEVHGHDEQALLDVFAQANQHTDGPVMLIANTFKGHGLPIEDKEGYHGKPFDAKEVPHVITVLQASAGVMPLDTVKLPPVPDAAQEISTTFSSTPWRAPFAADAKVSPRKAFGMALQDLGACDVRVMALDADVQNSTFVELFAKIYANRFVQCMVAEQAMLGVATGLASRGAIPFAATFGAFFARCYDQLRMAAIGKIPLRLCGSHAGVSIGQDGPSQMALEDIALFGALPDSVILYPADGVASYALTYQMYRYDKGITYLRATRGDAPVLYKADEPFPIGGCKVLRQSDNDQACVVAAGITLHEALKAHAQLAQEGINIAVIDLYSVKPLDAATVRRVVQASGNYLISVEDHYQWGGIGQALAVALQGDALQHQVLAVPDVPRSGSPEELLAWAGIDAQAIVRAVKKQVNT